MKVASWNVNSIRMRLPRIVRWLERREPDVVCLQETKVTDEDFPSDALEALGYGCCFFGQKSYNGVAILSRRPVSDIRRSLPDDGPDVDCRILSAVIDGIRIINVYAPNGRAIGAPQYEGKLQWYRKLRLYFDENLAPDDEILLCGDLNVAPEDRDVWDPAAWRERVLFSEPEKEALRDLMAWGLVDALRLRHPEGGLYTWWDYRAGAFHRGWGLRIDHVLVTRPLARRCLDVEIDRDERKGEKPSDHAPLMATFS